MKKFIRFDVLFVKIWQWDSCSLVFLFYLLKMWSFYYVRCHSNLADYSLKNDQGSLLNVISRINMNVAYIVCVVLQLNLFIYLCFFWTFCFHLKFQIFKLILKYLLCSAFSVKIKNPVLRCLFFHIIIHSNAHRSLLYTRGTQKGSGILL